jgi:hypothetical protein
MTRSIATVRRRAVHLASRLGIASLVLVIVVLVLAGCGGTTTSSNTSSTTTAVPSTTATQTSTTAASGTTQTSLSTFTPEQKAYTEAIKATANAARELSKKLEAEGLNESDPRAALLLGLHAPTQAVSARKFIYEKDLANADLAYRELRSLLARAAIYATQGTAAGVKAAQARLETVTAPPSQDAVTAAAALDDVIKDLAPLLDIANKETGADTTPSTGLIAPSTSGSAGSVTTGTT